MSDQHPPLPVNIPTTPTNQTLVQMLAARRWLLYKVRNPEPGKKARKPPYYANGQPRGEGLKLDSPEDLAQLVSYDEAVTAYQNAPKDEYEGLGIALGRDEASGLYWQGCDFDDPGANQISDIANEWINGASAEWCYPEYSPNSGLHVVSLGRWFPPLGDNKTGIEAYSSGRYFTFTGNQVPILPQGRMRHGRPGDLHDYVVDVLRPRHKAGKTADPRDSYAGRAETVVSPTTIAALRSAIHFWNPNDYDDWYRSGLALKELGLPGWDIWDTWSQHSLEKYDPKDAIKKWQSFQPDGRTSYQSIFKVAQDRTWVNPDSKEALSVRICSRCWATLALPPLRLDLATGELNVPGQ